MEKDHVLETWKRYFEGSYNLDKEEHFAVSMCGFKDPRRGNYFGGEPVSRTEAKRE